MIHGIAKSIWGGPYVEWEVLGTVRSARDTVENNEKQIATLAFIQYHVSFEAQKTVLDGPFLGWMDQISV